MLPVELWERNSKSSSLPVDRKYQKGKSKHTYIILLFNSKYKRQWINVNFLQDNHNINAIFCNINTISMHWLKIWDKGEVHTALILSINRSPK